MDINNVIQTANLLIASAWLKKKITIIHKNSFDCRLLLFISQIVRS